MISGLPEAQRHYDSQLPPDYTDNADEDEPWFEPDYCDEPDYDPVPYLK